jgi:lysozyme
VDAGIIPGTSHFFLPTLDALKQAEHYLSVIKEVVGGHACLPPAIDLETAGTTKTAINTAVRSFMEEVRRQAGRPGLLYTSPGFWGTYLPAPVLSLNRLKPADVEWAADYPLWLAHYTTGWPSQVYPWAGWTFWQYSSYGKVKGLPTRADMNLFNGSEADLAALAGEA